MDIAAMRARFKLILAGLADAESNAEIDERLDGFHQYVVPLDVDGSLSEGEWLLNLTVGIGEYSYPETVAAVLRQAPLLDDDQYISRYTRPADFWRRYDRGGSVSGRPEAALFYGRVVHVRPVPTSAHQMRSFVRKFENSIYLDLSSIAIDNRERALATVYGAAHEFALDHEDDETAEKLAARYADKIGRLRTMSVAARSSERRPIRSF